jgi:hypothetical protein
MGQGWGRRGYARLGHLGTCTENNGRSGRCSTAREGRGRERGAQVRQDNPMRRRGRLGEGGGMRSSGAGCKGVRGAHARWRARLERVDGDARGCPRSRSRDESLRGCRVGVVSARDALDPVVNPELDGRLGNDLDHVGAVALRSRGMGGIHSHRFHSHRFHSHRFHSHRFHSHRFHSHRFHSHRTFTPRPSHRIRSRRIHSHVCIHTCQCIMHQFPPSPSSPAYSHQSHACTCSPHSHLEEARNAPALVDGSETTEHSRDAARGGTGHDGQDGTDLGHAAVHARDGVVTHLHQHLDRMMGGGGGSSCGGGG